MAMENISWGGGKRKNNLCVFVFKFKDGNIIASGNNYASGNNMNIFICSSK